MKRRTFIQLSSALTLAPMVSPFHAFAKDDKLKNWAGNLTYSTDNVFYPTSVEEVQELVKNTAK